jgi:hypothetical protein
VLSKISISRSCHALQCAPADTQLKTLPDRPLLWLDCMKLHLVSQGRFILEAFWFIALLPLQSGGGGDGLPATGSDKRLKNMLGSCGCSVRELQCMECLGDSGD